MTPINFRLSASSPEQQRASPVTRSSNAEHAHTATTNLATPLFNVLGDQRQYQLRQPTLTLATCAPGFTTLHNSHIEGHPHSPGRSGTEFAAQLVRPRPRPNNLAASTGNCRKSSPRRCRVPLVDKGRQGKVDKLAARRGEFDSR